jgi:hypothetical protein
VTVPTPNLPIARIGSEAPEFPGRPAPSLTLVGDTPGHQRGRGSIPLFCSALIIGTSFFATPALTNGSTGEAASGATLNLSFAYYVLAPICDTLDTLSLFSQGQHLAFVLTFAVLFASWRVVRRQQPTNRRGARDEVVAGCKALGVLLSVYAFGAALPRPIARLTMSSPDAVVIDFHSHTRYSWDGRSSFSPEASRRWHHAAGFDVAYITDHSTFAGAEQGALDNPLRAGDATVLLSGIEVRDRGNHLVVLGTDAADWRSYTAGDLHERIFQRQSERRGSARPVLLLTLPGNLRSAGAMSVDGIEISDAAPRGLSESDALRGEIISLAAKRKKALVASSNNHGWASATPAWSVMQISNWREMTPAQLDVAIRRQILGQWSSAVQVIDHRTPAPVSFAGLSLTAPDAGWRMLRMMSWPERMSWLIWMWVACALAMIAQKMRIAKRSRAHVERA